MTQLLRLPGLPPGSTGSPDSQEDDEDDEDEDPDEALFELDHDEELRTSSKHRVSPTAVMPG